MRPGNAETQRNTAARGILTRLAKSLDNDPLKNGGTIRILHEGFARGQFGAEMVEIAAKTNMFCRCVTRVDT